MRCDVYSGEELARHLAGCEAVVSCLGVTGYKWPWSNVTLYSDSIKVSVMACTHVILVVSGLPSSEGDILRNEYVIYAGFVTSKIGLLGKTNVFYFAIVPLRLLSQSIFHIRAVY